MKEVKDPVTRFREIFEFDESHARGKPLDDIPEGGNIPEIIPEAEAVIAKWNGIQSQLKELVTRFQIVETDIAKIEKEIATKKREQREESHQREMEEMEREERGKGEGKLQRHKLLEPLAEIPEYAILYSLKAERKSILKEAQSLEKEADKMQRLDDEVAYLQACSEFYILRQQEEVENRIAIEQATCFGREMGPTAHDKQFTKEKQTLFQWKQDAERLANLMTRKKEDRLKRHTTAASKS